MFSLLLNVLCVRKTKCVGVNILPTQNGMSILKYESVNDVLKDYEDVIVNFRNG